MRNLKKILALVLVLVMAMSFASAASFSDVEANEAIDVMSAVGVINGYEDGTFKPEKVLTREEAMKIVAYLDLTKTIAETLEGQAIFTDVAADRWSSGYIAYAYTTGVVDGNGDGTFAPTAELTGYAFAKMILNVLGIEGEYTGLLWKTNINNALAANKVLLNGLEKVNLAAPMTRAQATQMAFNALWVGGEDVATGEYGIKVAAESTYAAELGELAKLSFESSLEAMLTVASVVEGAKLGKDYTVVEKTIPGTGELAEKHDVRAYTVVDEFGIETNGHCSISVDKKGNPVAVYTATEESYETYQTIAKSALHGLFKGKAKTPVEITYIVDGAEGTLTVVDTDKTGVVGGAGVEVLVCADKVVVKNIYALGQVTKVVPAKADDPKTEADESAKAYVEFDNDAENTLVTDEYVEGEYVLGTIANGEVVEHWAAEVVEAKLSKRTTSYVVLNGTKYAIADTTGALSYGTDAYNKAYDYYVYDGVVYDTVDCYTPAVDTSKVAADEFVYIVEVGYSYVNKAAAGGSLFADPTAAEVEFVAKVKYVDLEGNYNTVELAAKDVTKKTDTNPVFEFVNWNGTKVTVELTKDKDTVIGAVNDWAALYEGEFVKFADINNAVKTVLTAEVAEKASAINGIKTTKSSTYTLVNPVTEEIVTLTGSKIKIAKDANVLILTQSNGKVVKSVYEMSFDKASNDPVVSDANWAYVVEVGAEVADGIYECVVFVDGAQKPMTVAGADTIVAGYVYDLVLTDGVITGVKAEGVKVEAQGTVTEIYAGEFFELTDADYVDLHKDCVVYDLVNYELGELTVGAKVFVVRNDANAAILVYVVG